MTKAEIVLALQGRNPGAPDASVFQLATHLHEYREAQANIDEHGTVVQHPKTGTPIENPYLGIRDRSVKAIAALLKVRALKTDGLWV